jgi:hypothetical protein
MKQSPHRNTDRAPAHRPDRRSAISSIVHSSLLIPNSFTPPHPLGKFLLLLIILPGLFIASCGNPAGPSSPAAAQYTVTFETNGGTPAPVDQNVAEGGKATAPAAMTKSGYTFGGWHREAA